jgi:hypothetical protein
MYVNQPKGVKPKMGRESANEEVMEIGKES